MNTLESFSFTEQTRNRISENLDDFEEIRLNKGDSRAAAVTVTIIDDGGQAAIILTRRSSHLRAHGGQWSLPGGSIDPGESIHEAALRELQEEINLDLEKSSIVGTLDDYRTRSGFIITPIVIWADVQLKTLRANPDEVASIHRFGFPDLVRKDSPYLESISESDQPVLSMHYEDDRIFAPTGAILYQFREVAILGKATRVAHFDQPVFAWK